MFKTFLTAFFWSIIATMAIPTTLILASWNATPGDSTYKLKVGLEKAMLGVTPSDTIKSSLQIKYTERRFDEVEKVISTSHAGESLDNFNNQVIASKNSIQEIKNVEEKNIQTQNLIDTLEEVSQKIEKETLVRQTEKIVSNTSKPLSTPTAIINNEVGDKSPTKVVITTIPTPIVTSPPLEQDIADELDETNEKIEEIIDELKESQNQNHGLENKEAKNKKEKDNGVENERDKKKK
jgi:Domain of unknown function (DUF5667)